MERWGIKQRRILAKRRWPGSADSWEPLLISYFCALQDDWGCYGATLQEFRASTEGTAACSHRLTIIHTSKLQHRKGCSGGLKKIK